MSPDKPSSSDPARFDLALSTWFFVLLHDHNVVGGLPNEFLADAAASLLVFDKVVCCEEALAWEIRFKDRWLSSQLFSALDKEGLFKPVSMRRLMKESVVPMLAESGLAQAARDTMASQLTLIKSGAQRTHLRVPSNLMDLNKLIFASLSLQLPQTILFQGKENYFRVPSPRVKVDDKGSDTSTEAPLRERDANFVSIVRSILPDFCLLPPLQPRSEGANALRTALVREKPMVLRYAFGDPDVDQGTILDFRLGAGFQVEDAKIDEPRKAQAWNNFELLVKVRSETADVRQGVQKIIDDVINGRRTPAEVRRELAVHQEELLSHLPDTRTARFGVRLAGAAIFAGLVEALSHIPGPSLVFHAIDWFRAQKEGQHLAALRRQYPLPFLLKDFRRARHEQAERVRG